jgi:hypothetical protein
LSLNACVCTRLSDDEKSNSETTTKLQKALLSVTQAFTLDESAAQKDLQELTKAPHPFGSSRQAKVSAYLKNRLENAGIDVKLEAFFAVTPNPAALNATGPIQPTMDFSGTNIYGFSGAKARPECVVALASHYDTKIIEGVDYVGANDSGSSTVALIQQIIAIKSLVSTTTALTLKCEIVGIFFDGEEAVLPNWSDGYQLPTPMQDNTYGSRYGASRLQDCTYEDKKAKCLPEDLGGLPLLGLILMDMIGSPNLNITRDLHSAPALIRLAKEAATKLGFPDAYGLSSQAIEDDHISYRSVAIPVIDLIDFNTLTYWHQAGDDATRVSTQSIEKAAKIALWSALAVAHDPQVLSANAD